MVDVGEGDEGVLGLVGELAEDTGLVDGAVVSPDGGAFFDPFAGGEAGDEDLVASDVGAIEGGDGDGVVEEAVLVEGAAESTVVGGGIADEEKLDVAGGHDGFDGLEDGVGDAFGFVDDDEHVWGVEALKLVGLVGREADGEAVVVDVEAGMEELAAWAMDSTLVEAVNFAPEDVAHLAGGGCGGEDGGGLVGGEEPEGSGGGSEALANAVAGLNGDAAVVAEGVEDFFLLVPKLDAKDVLGEADGIVAHVLAGGVPPNRQGGASGGVYCHELTIPSMTSMSMPVGAGWAGRGLAP